MTRKEKLILLEGKRNGKVSTTRRENPASLERETYDHWKKKTPTKLKFSKTLKTKTSLEENI